MTNKTTDKTPNNTNVVFHPRAEITHPTDERDSAFRAFIRGALRRHIAMYDFTPEQANVEVEKRFEYMCKMRKGDAAAAILVTMSIDHFFNA